MRRASPDLRPKPASCPKKTEVQGRRKKKKKKQKKNRRNVRRLCYRSTTRQATRWRRELLYRPQSPPTIAAFLTTQRSETAMQLGQLGGQRTVDIVV
jgi:hypothetical protein